MQSFVFALLAYFSIGDSAYAMEPTHAQYNFSSYNFSQQGPLALKGHWKFWWQQEPTTQALQNWNHPHEILVPGGWADYDNGSLTPTQNGWGVFGFRIKSLKNPIRLVIPNIGSSYKLVLKNSDGSLSELGGAGKFSEQEVNHLPWTQLLSYAIPASKDWFVILLYVSNYEIRHGGVFEPPILMTMEQEHRFRFTRFSLTATVMGMIIILGFYHMSLFLYRREDIPSLCLSIWSILYALRLYGMEGFHASLMKPSLAAFDWKWRFEMIGIVVPGLFVFSISSSFRQYSWVYLSRSLLALSMILCFPVLFTPPKVFMSLLPLVQAFNLGSIVLCSLISLRAVFGGASGGMTSLIGCLILFLAGIHDVLVARGMLAPP